MAEIRLYCFGFPRILANERECAIERRKALALAACMALAERPQSRDQVATLLWPDLDQEHARAALRSTLPALTALAPVAWLKVDRATLALDRDLTWVDVSEFLGLLAQARVHPHPPDQVCAECHTLLERAVALYADAFLAGFSLTDSVEFDDWQATQRERLRRELAGALRRMAGYERDAGDYERAIGHARQWLALDPLHEPAHRLLMRLAALNGQRSEALRQYQRCVDLLDAELATPPEHETTALYAAIKAQDGALTQDGPAAARPHGVLPPLPALIVGRERALRDLKQRVGVGGERRLALVVQGWPGVGKSTTIAALAHDPEIAVAFPDGVLWASLGETPNLLAELQIWADALKVPANQAASPASLTAQLTAAAQDKRLLIIVDDVWQEEHAAPFRIGGHGSALVLTSRLNEVAQALAPTSQDVYRLPVLGDDPALELLRLLAPDVVADYPDEARELVRDLEGLPLAIQVAGRLLQSEARLGWGLSDLLRELGAGAALLTAQAPSDMLGAGRDTTPTIATLLRRSTEALDAETRERFALLGLFAPKPATFDLQAMLVAWETDDPKPSARLLVNRGLLEPVSGGRFQMHALLMLHARSLMDGM